MGYACPVCEIPQRDGEHLANHLAFTAMLRGGPHADWLDEHVPDWGETDPDALADRVTPHAAETSYDEVFEDTTDDHDHPDPPAGRGDPGLSGGRSSRTGDLTDDVLQEARELTRQMYEDSSARPGEETENDTDEPGDDGTDEPRNGGTEEPGDDGTDEPRNGGTEEPGDDGTEEPGDDGTDEPGDDGTDEPGDDGTDDEASDESADGDREP